jgi:hypothetical protein
MMSFDEIKKYNEQQIAKYSGEYLYFIPPFLADLAIGHGLLIDDYLIGTWQYEPGCGMVEGKTGDVSDIVDNTVHDVSVVHNSPIQQ